MTTEREEAISGRVHTPGPWEYIASTEHHGAYVMGPFGDVCDCYTMSNPNLMSTLNGGVSYPVPFQGDEMDANARLIAAAPDLLAALSWFIRDIDADRTSMVDFDENVRRSRAAIAKATGSTT